jgi:predicted Rossmann-fold nucleotide-binding protein
LLSPLAEAQTKDDAGLQSWIEAQSILQNKRLPFDPLRRRLYSQDELFRQIDLRPESLTHALDYRIYRFFVMEGSERPISPFVGMMEGVHDNSIGQAVIPLLEDQTRTPKEQPRLVGVMGGHKLARGSAGYVQVARIARALAGEGIVMVSGGGPGAMEATHLGASFGNEPDHVLHEAIASLQRSAEKLPALSGLVSKSGTFDPKLRNELHGWLWPALMLARDRGTRAKRSLSLPTWHYGFEPTSPFATDIAKYFQNSLREDGLVTVCGDGIVYSEGKAGTLQEIFQDAAQNYYRSIRGRFSPMVFLGRKLWEEDMPVMPLLRALFREGEAKKAFVSRVLVTDEWEKAVEFLLTPASFR